MGRVYDEIAQAIREDRIVFSLHADNQLVSRGILRWQAVEGFTNGELLNEQPQAKPHPKIRVRQMLPDGTSVIAIWAFVRSMNAAKLVTIFFEDTR